jgi:integrase
MHLLRRGRIWYIAWQEQGRKRRESTGFTSKKAAQRVFDLKQHELADPAHHAAHQATVRSAAESFLKEIKRESISDATRLMYDQKIRHVVRVLGDVRLASLTYQHVGSFIETRENEGAKAHTIHKELTAFRRALRIASLHGHFPRDPRSLFPRYSTGYEPTEQWIDEASLWAVMAHLEPSRAAWLALMVSTGARLNEAKRARRGDVTLKQIRIRGTKTDKSARVVPVLAMMVPFVRFVLEHADGIPPMLFRPWGNLRRDLHRSCARAGVAAFGPNQLRHTTATWLVRGGAPLHLVSKILGHASTKMLERVYGHLDADDVGRLLEVHLRSTAQEKSQKAH